MNTEQWNAVTRCNMGSCPTVYTSDVVTDVLIQGFAQSSTEAPDGQESVRVPRELLEQAAAEMASRM